MTKKKIKKPVFEALLECDVCFAVCIASCSFVIPEIAVFSKDYFVIINKCDAVRVEGFTFYATEGYKQLCERTLSVDEIKWFKANMDRFIKVRHNEHGRVYELKRRSFKATYDAIKRQLRCRIIKNDN